MYKNYEFETLGVLHVCLQEPIQSFLSELNYASRVLVFFFDIMHSNRLNMNIRYEIQRNPDKNLSCLLFYCLNFCHLSCFVLVFVFLCFCFHFSFSF